MKLYSPTPNPLRVGLVVPHIFMHRDILSQVIFSPGHLALELAAGLMQINKLPTSSLDSRIEVTLFTPGPVDTVAHNVTADLSYFQQELSQRGDTYIELLKKHPFTFITLARQVQAELIAKAFTQANNDELDIIHIYTNEEDTALPFASFCRKPVIFTHHDPFNFMVKYKSAFPKYTELNWLSISNAQRAGMPAHTNWIDTIYHGLAEHAFTPNYTPTGNYIAYFGRIIEPKGVHLAIQALRRYNATASTHYKLKIAGKHYAGHAKDNYWQAVIQPQLGADIEYVGYLQDTTSKQAFLGNAVGLLVPSIFDEPFGMVMIEALACGTPLLGLDSGAIPEVITSNKTGFLVGKTFQNTPHKRTGEPQQSLDEAATVEALAAAIPRLLTIDRHDCRRDFESRFTLAIMCQKHAAAYQKLVTANAHTQQ